MGRYMDNGYYDYQDLAAKVLEAMPNPAQEDLNALGEWFSHHGMSEWNGESYAFENGYRLRPVYRWDEAADTGELVGYEIC